MLIFANLRLPTCAITIMPMFNCKFLSLTFSLSSLMPIWLIVRVSWAEARSPTGLKPTFNKIKKSGNVQLWGGAGNMALRLL